MLRNNILLSAIFKITSLITSLLIVPITIGYLNNEVYGVWMTISSILFWVSSFDIGLGNGMRNYLAESISNHNFEMGRKYITTTFVFLSIIALLMFILVVISMFFLNFNNIFNTNNISGHQLRDALFIAISFTLLNFVLKNVGYIFIALQKYAFNELLNVSANVLSLLLIYILTKNTQGNIIYVVLTYTATATIIYIISAIPLFIKYPQLKPNMQFFDKTIGRQIVGKGLGFFVIQITSCLVIFGAANIFITQFCGPSEVTVYNIAYKYFNLLIIAYYVIIAPMWSSYTDAYVKNDWDWIRKTFNRALKFWVLSVFAGCVMLLLSQTFFQLWIGDKVTVPFSVSLCTFIYVSLFNLNNCTTYLINGLNKIKVQIMTSIASTILYIAVTFFITGKYDIEGIVLSMAGSYAIMCIIHLYQCRLLINNKAKGIWNR